MFGDMLARVPLGTRTAPRTDTDTWNDGSRFALTADRPTRTLTRTLTRTPWGDQCLDAVGCTYMLCLERLDRLIRPARDAVG